MTREAGDSFGQAPPWPRWAYADERTRATRVNPDAVWWMRRQLWHNVRDRSGPDTPAYFYLAERFGEWPPRDRDVVRKGS